MPSGTPIYESSVIVRAADQLECEVGDDTAILNFENNTYFGLNPVGSVVWKMLAAPISIRQIRDALVDQYEVDPEQCLTDVIRLIGDLLQHQLITRVDG